MTTIEPRAALIARVTREALRATGDTLRAFAARVADTYQRRTHADDRAIDFHASADPYADERANAQLITRMLNGETRLPADLEEAWVLALPEPQRGRLLSKLSGRYGLLAVPMAEIGTGDDTLRVCALLRETAEAVQALAPLLRDGNLHTHCAQSARAAITELRQAEAVAAGLRIQIQRLMLGREAAHAQS